MNTVQNISLISCVANDKSVMFKLNINGEEKVFIGKQNNAFEQEVPVGTTKLNDIEKLSGNLRSPLSFQQVYEIDRQNIGNENRKKDVSVPVAFSKDIVQFGDYLMTLTDQTNNDVLYALYKNRLINRYVSDKMETIFYDFSKVLKGKTTKEILEIIKSNNFNVETNEIDGYKIYEAAETKRNYGVMEGLVDTPDDIFIHSSKTNPTYNMLYEFGNDYQYEYDNSNIYLNFIHLKNNLSPFFNVDVINSQYVDNSGFRYQLWRDFKKVDKTTDNIWTSYNLKTPYRIDKEYNSEFSESSIKFGKFIVGNIKPDASVESYNDLSYYYFNNLLSIGGLTPSVVPTYYNDLSSEGFTVHINANKDQVMSGLLYAFERREKAKFNYDRNYLYTTPEQFAEMFVNSKYVKDNDEFSGYVWDDPTIDTYDSGVFFKVSTDAIPINNNSYGQFNEYDRLIKFEAVKDVDDLSKIPAKNTIKHKIQFYNELFYIVNEGCELYIDGGKTKATVDDDISVTLDIKLTYSDGLGNVSTSNLNKKQINLKLNDITPVCEKIVMGLEQAKAFDCDISFVDVDFEFNIIKDNAPYTLKKGDYIILRNIRTAPFELGDVSDDNKNSLKYWTSNTGSTVSYEAVPITLKSTFNWSGLNKSPDAALTDLSEGSFLIDIFGLYTNGLRNPNFLDNESILLSNISNISTEYISIDLSVAFKNDNREDALIIKTFVNGNQLLTQTFTTYDWQYNFLKEYIKSADNIRLSFFGDKNRIKNSSTNQYVTYFDITDTALLNYPISINQSQILFNSELKHKNVSNVMNNTYIIYETNFKEDINGDYGKVFDFTPYVYKTLYAYNGKSNPDFNRQNSREQTQLYKIQDFDYIDVIDGLNKLKATTGRKSNLYSVKLRNTGLVIDEDDDQETKEFKSEVGAMLESTINTICSKVEPLNTKLFSIIIDS